MASRLLDDAMHHVYILYSPSRDRYYTGQTADMDRRLSFHAAGQTKSTRLVKDWHLVFRQSLPSRTDAMQLEHRLKKSKSRKTIQRFIRDPRNELQAPLPLAM